MTTATGRPDRVPVTWYRGGTGTPWLRELVSAATNETAPPARWVCAVRLAPQAARIRIGGVWRDSWLPHDVRMVTGWECGALHVGETYRQASFHAERSANNCWAVAADRSPGRARRRLARLVSLIEGVREIDVEARAIELWRLSRRA